jgi:hypothetical protein
MTEHSFSIEADDPTKRTLTTFVPAGLILSKSLNEPGYWYEMKYPERVQIKDMTSKHIIVSGYGLGTNGLPDQLEGWVSSDDDRYIEPGTYRREFPEGCVIWCIRNTGKSASNPTNSLSVAHVKTLCLQPNETVEIPAKDNLFVLTGSCLMGNKSLTAEKHYVLGDQPRTIVAQSKTYLVHWPDLLMQP